MAKPSLELIGAIRRTAKKLKEGAPYQWGHMGSCNCGHLAQEITHFTKAEIHQFAMRKSGDWSEQVLEYCPNSGYPMDMMITGLLTHGLTLNDLRNLEWLSDSKILNKLAVRNLRRNDKEHVIAYMNAWAGILEDALVERIHIDKLFHVESRQQKSVICT